MKRITYEKVRDPPVTGRVAGGKLTKHTQKLLIIFSNTNSRSNDKWYIHGRCRVFVCLRVLPFSRTVIATSFPEQVVFFVPEARRHPRGGMAHEGRSGPAPATAGLIKHFPPMPARLSVQGTLRIPTHPQLLEYSHLPSSTSRVNREASPSLSSIPLGEDAAQRKVSCHTAQGLHFLVANSNLVADGSTQLLSKAQWPRNSRTQTTSSPCRRTQGESLHGLWPAFGGQSLIPPQSQRLRNLAKSHCYF